MEACSSITSSFLLLLLLVVTVADELLPVEAARGRTSSMLERDRAGFFLDRLLAVPLETAKGLGDVLEAFGTRGTANGCQVASDCSRDFGEIGEDSARWGIPGVLELSVGDES